MQFQIPIKNSSCKSMKPKKLLGKEDMPAGLKDFTNFGRVGVS